jgi:CHAD domain-containing protein
MSYKIISGRPLPQEVKRLLDREIIAAMSSLSHPLPGAQVGGVHDARTHIKKARALLRLVRRPLGRRYLEVDDELRIANRALGPIADGRRILETLAATRRIGTVALPMTAFAAVRWQLASRASAVEEGAAVDDVRGRTIRLLNSLKQEIATTDLLSLDRDAIAVEIRDAHAVARKARRGAITRPSVDSYHRWRRCVKREWYLLRLVSELTGDRLKDERHQLAALDACLGELHDVHVLIGAAAANAPLSRTQMSRLLKALRTHAHDLRHLAGRLSPVLDERPRRLARRVRALWGSSRTRSAAPAVQPWPLSA